MRGSAETDARPRRRLIRKYVALVAALVVAALLTSGLTELYFSYQDNKEALTRIQGEKARSAAASIDQFLDPILLQLRGVAHPPAEEGTKGLDERDVNYLRLFDRVPDVSQVRYLDASGKEQLRVSQFDIEVRRSGETPRTSRASSSRGRRAPTSVTCSFAAARSRTWKSPSPSPHPDAGWLSPRST